MHLERYMPQQFWLRAYFSNFCWLFILVKLKKPPDAEKIHSVTGPQIHINANDKLINYRKHWQTYMYEYAIEMHQHNMSKYAIKISQWKLLIQCVCNCSNQSQKKIHVVLHNFNFRTGMGKCSKFQRIDMYDNLKPRAKSVQQYHKKTSYTITATSRGKSGGR